MLKDIDVVILCGGFGKRLKRVSGNLPKSMVKIGGRRFLDMLIGSMAGLGFRKFILCTGYKHEVIRNYYKNNKNKNIRIIFSREKKPLGTGGALMKAGKLIRSDPIIVLNGDSFCKLSILGILEFHKIKKALITIAVAKKRGTTDYGEVLLDRSSRVKAFREKRRTKGMVFVNAGLYVCARKIFKLMPRKNKFSLERDFFPKLAGDNLYGYKNTIFFVDIGTPNRYKKAGILLPRLT